MADIWAFCLEMHWDMLLRILWLLFYKNNFIRIFMIDIWAFCHEMHWDMLLRILWMISQHCLMATSHYLNQCWPRPLAFCDITREQWVMNYLCLVDIPVYHYYKKQSLSDITADGCNSFVASYKSSNSSPCIPGESGWNQNSKSFSIDWGITTHSYC